MTSKLRPTLVGMGIALGATLPGCLGKSDSDEDGSSDRSRVPDSEAYVAEPSEQEFLPPGESPSAAGGGDSPPVDEPMTDPTLAAFCDSTWPPTKGRPDPPTPLCVDPGNECDGVELPRQCYAIIDERTCNYDEPFTGPLHCVDGAWECPPGSTVGFSCVDDECESECVCWGPLPDGYTCGENGPVGIGGAPGSN